MIVVGITEAQTSLGSKFITGGSAAEKQTADGEVGHDGTSDGKATGEEC